MSQYTKIKRRAWTQSLFLNTLLLKQNSILSIIVEKLSLTLRQILNIFKNFLLFYTDSLSLIKKISIFTSLLKLI